MYTDEQFERERAIEDFLHPKSVLRQRDVPIEESAKTNVNPTSRPTSVPDKDAMTDLTTLKAEARESYRACIDAKGMTQDEEMWLSDLIDRVHNAALDLAEGAVPAEIPYALEQIPVMHEVFGRNACRTATLQALKNLRV